MTTAWTADHIKRIDMSHAPRVPVLGDLAQNDLSPDTFYWDMWPIQNQNGSIATLRGRELWMILAAPNRGDPVLRHLDARIHLLERVAGRWIDLGRLLPDFPSPYDREWSGSAVTDGEAVTLYFTGAGLKDRPGGYQQALYQTTGRIDNAGLPTGWSIPTAIGDQGDQHYLPADTHDGVPGKIKAFRDPAYFRDPGDGAEYLLFTGSLAASDNAYNGAVGLLKKQTDGHWAFLPPLIHADGVNNELERAHAVFHNGRYYVFWVTQQSTFAPEVEPGPTGLYGMTADTLLGPYHPINGSGLALANPQQEPFQCYSWFASTDLTVCSFVDFVRLNGQPIPTDPGHALRHFGGVPAPLLRLCLDGDTCTVNSDMQR